MSSDPWRFDASDPELQRIANNVRTRGGDDDMLRLCLGMSALDRIIQNHRGRRRHVFFASFPKSGTTFLHRLLLEATGFPDYLIDRFSEDQQQNIIRQWMPMLLAQDTVTQVHMFATRPNVRMLRELGARPVVLVRDLKDVLVSLRDHLVNEDHIVPMAQVPEEFKDWEMQRQMWFLVRMATPWYLNFFVSWQRVAEALDVLWVRYEDLIAQPQATLERVLAHAGVELPRERIVRAVRSVDRGRIRLNVGVTGRGAMVLTEAQQQAIDDIAACYDGCCDFSMIGLSGCGQADVVPAGEAAA